MYFVAIIPFFPGGGCKYFLATLPVFQDGGGKFGANRGGGNLAFPPFF